MDMVILALEDNVTKDMNAPLALHCHSHAKLAIMLLILE